VQAGTIEIPAWAFDRGNVVIDAAPAKDADAGPVVVILIRIPIHYSSDQSRMDFSAGTGSDFMGGVGGQPLKEGSHPHFLVADRLGRDGLTFSAKYRGAWKP
jgi:hypothetical protein